MLDFPSVGLYSGYQYTDPNSVIWVYDGVKWNIYLGTGSRSGMSGYSGWSGISGYSGQDGLPGQIAASYYGPWDEFTEFAYNQIVLYQGSTWVWAGVDGTAGAVPGVDGGWLLLSQSGYSGYSGAGTSGWSGYSGTSGWSGYSGTSGWSGAGTSGWSGYSGTSGWSGAGTSGYSGISGFSGYSGSGISGWSGFSGISGYSGSGISGWSGFSGISGYSGFSGAAGPSTSINATNQTDTTAYYIVGVSAAGSNQTANVATTNPVVFTGAGGLAVGTTTNPGAGAIYATSNITAYYSDERLKKRIKNIENALDKVKQLSGFLYQNNETANKYGYMSDKVQVGLSAQDVQRVQPEIVSPAPFDLDEQGHSKSGEDYLTIDYEKLVPLLVEAIKELSDQIEEIKAKKE